MKRESGLRRRGNKLNGELYQCYCLPSGGEEYCNLLSVNPARRAASDHFLREMRC